MPTDTSVKFLHSAMSGAPSLAGQAGSLIALLDALLVNGFGLVTVDSVVIDGGVGTITRGAGLPFEQNSVALIAGATVTGGSINGERKIIAATATTATFDATGISNQTAGGSITVKFAPLGWAKTYSGTNLAAYKPVDVTATGNILRLDDTGATTARARGFESMSDVNSGTGLFPTDVNVSGGVYWPKSSTADSTSRSWVLVGDGRVFYLLTSFSTAASQTFGFNAAFGDLAAVKSPDAYACFVHGMTSATVTNAGNNGSQDFDTLDGNSAGPGTYCARGYVGLGGNVAMRRNIATIAGAAVGRSGQIGLPFPNFADGGLYLSPVYAIEHVNGVYRGTAPGVFGVPQVVGSAVFNSRDVLSSVVGFSGRDFRIVNSAGGCIAFDVTGPWR